MIYFWAVGVYIVGFVLTFYIVGRVDPPSEKNGYDKDPGVYVGAALWPIMLLGIGLIWPCVTTYKYWKVPFIRADQALFALYRKGVDNAWRRQH